MAEIIKSISEFLQAQGPLVSTLVVAIVALVTSFRIFLRYKTEISETQPQQDAFRAQQVPKNLDNLAELLIQNFRILNSFYSENLSQYRNSSIASISVAVLGFIVIIAGVLIAFLSNQVTLGAVSSASGIIGEAAAVLFFRQTRTFQIQMESSLQKLVSAQYLMTSIALAKELEGEAKTKEFTQINNHLRTLMNALHGH
jgi:hypothetical protein